MDLGAEVLEDVLHRSVIDVVAEELAALVLLCFVPDEHLLY